MTALNVTVGLILFISILVFLIYAGMAIRHATHFRYLSRRMLVLTLLFFSSSVILIGLIVTSYILFLVK